MELQIFLELFFLPLEGCVRRQDWPRDQVLVALLLPPLPVVFLPFLSQAFESLVVLTMSPVELYEPLVGLFLGPAVLPFLSM